MEINDDERQLDARIDASLRQTYAPPARVAPPAAGRVPSPVQIMVAAAVLALLFLGGHSLLRRGQPGPTVESTAEAQLKVASWIGMFDEAAGGEGLAACVCGPDCCTLVEHCHAAFGVGLDLAEGVEFVPFGECCRAPGGEGVTMSAHVRDRLVCLFVVPTAGAPEVLATGREDLRLFKRRVGEVTAFEVSELDEPALLPHLIVQ